ncbi:MAG: hypothetical protein JXA10_19815, partial [Anaerolineae bacterium]|nr:hypothetical protein [Anaerolineae bacterium]
MTHENEAVHEPVHDMPDPDSPAMPRILQGMILHFLLAGAGLFLAAAGLFWLDYQDLMRIDLGLDLRITNPGTIYEQATQINLAGALILSAMSLLPLRAVNSLNHRHQNAITLARITALLLLAGLLIAGGLGWYMNRMPVSREEMSTTQQLLDEVTLAVYVIIALLILQSGLALWYQFWLSSAEARQLLQVKQTVGQVRWQRWRAVGLVAWIVLLIGLGIGLGIATEWLYEWPVDRPAPGEFLYATTFDAFNEEWDTYQGRDRAEIADSD